MARGTKTCCGSVAFAFLVPVIGSTDSDSRLDGLLVSALKHAGFTGRIQQKFEKKLGRRINPKLADLGRFLWFDKLGGLHSDNTCGGCHSPANGFGDSQSIAIGVQNNNRVGPHRTGPRNQRRTPTAANTAFFPNLMWNGRFSAPSGNPFDNSQGFVFPKPEGTRRFPANDPTSRTCWSRRLTSLLLNSWKWRVLPARAAPSVLSSINSMTVWEEGASTGFERLSQRTDPPGGSCAPECGSRVSQLIRRAVFCSKVGTADSLHHVRQRDRRI